jgi:hypothetical protein
MVPGWSGGHDDKWMKKYEIVRGSRHLCEKTAGTGFVGCRHDLQAVCFARRDRMR